MNDLKLPTIEYRAWDTKDNRMIDWSELLDYRSGFVEYLRNPQELIFLPFVGKFDSTNNKIYAYDIVTAGDNFPSLIEWDNESGKWVLHEVYPRRGKYADKYDRYHELNAYTNGLGTIIGNYFQTPSLLGKFRRVI